MSFYEDKRDGVTARLLSKYGATMSLKVTFGEAFNAVTGSATGGTTKLYPIQAVVLTKKRSERADIAVRNDDLNVFVGASGLVVVPTTSDKINYQSKDYDIVSVTPVAPGGINVAFEIRMREP